MAILPTENKINLLHALHGKIQPEQAAKDRIQMSTVPVYMNQAPPYHKFFCTSNLNRPCNLLHFTLILWSNPCLVEWLSKSNMSVGHPVLLAHSFYFLNGHVGACY
ncbi:hypothetical protein O6P43_006753 [Quillaja saponaria]|uniref:Uncharacterized protein n=1 Tax=Quillaja saponaria TaxID=32244 RepID=A0AAD7VIK8_QUISA|nr:hypothetical protein O6P43_006753 [Quillaja saponaria]